jgi:hypothetical protein
MMITCMGQCPLSERFSRKHKGAVVRCGTKNSRTVFKSVGMDHSVR